MKHVNWTFNDFVSLVAIGVEQAVDVAEHIWKKVQVKPEHTPNQNERRPDVIFRAVSASPVPDKQPQTAEQSRDANQQSEKFVAEDAVTISRDLEHGNEVRGSENRHLLFLSTMNHQLSTSAPGLIKK